VTARSPAERSTEVEPGALSGEHSALLEQHAATNQLIEEMMPKGFSRPVIVRNVFSIHDTAG
jgi:hypothetical protein